MKKFEKINALSQTYKEMSENARQKGKDYQIYEDGARYLFEYAKLLYKKEENEKLSKVNTKWTEKEDEKLKAEYKKGWKVARMAKAHSRNLSGIVARLIKLGLITDDGENSNKRWSDEEDNLLILEAEKKVRLEQMAQSHQRSMSSILSRLEKLGYNIG